ncbi:winged helix storkhead-box1 domain protein [Leptolyngbya sp. Heron Island J]|uniref:BREX system P-loop protein BrxC n=1 Tax=Leptolyngbya sp. Heron Island J TaxID=1385935 RepID=UPI0003B96B6A|nr:BREX system P-loop protein BrxC [Leptolyngbya sp. Heron Island J]ESA32467.1 winged helix storkhead-box1 domain protein [Leptolyngbya sp. Heron Island J]
MKLQELFANDVTRDIPPVVYFHEQDPAKVAAEVGEYIITGGYRTDDPRYQYIKTTGIHEQFVRLLKGLANKIQKGNSALPASWISGFYGSGKSSFAKLLGLALDGMVLPDGTDLAATLLKRDDSPKSPDLAEAWHNLRGQIDPLAVVFDIGAVARDDEQIHSAIKRQLQKRLGYCNQNHYVAEHELKLELDGQWEQFLETAAAQLGRSWTEVKDSSNADYAFSRVLHHLDPELFVEPLSWSKVTAGRRTGIGTSAEETTKAIAQMLNHRAPGKTLFIVVDEVSQYIYQNTERMLALQSLVSSLGQRLKGQVWLLATGQQKLEDSDDESNISKLKDRFPSELRVHLAPTNIRDVVHKRLLKKKPAREPELAALFDQHRSDLKLYGYQCESIGKEDFLEVYPLLPGYVDLLMQITSNLRSRSTRAKSDDHAIRGLLQLLGELFREQKLGEKELGSLITIDNIFDVQQSALDNDVQNTLSRLFNNDEVINDPWAVRVAKAVALLELIQEQEATTPALVAQCLYDRLGKGNKVGEVTQALEKLRSLNLLSYSEKTGYKIQSSAGQEWEIERERHNPTSDAISEIIAIKLKELLGTTDNPKYKGKKFRWAAYYSDGRQRQNDKLQVPNELAVVTLDFHYLLKQKEPQSEQWVRTSANSDRIIWVVGKNDALESQIRELARSKRMKENYENRPTLSASKKNLLTNERGRYETLETRVKDAVAEAFLAGEIYFDGRPLDKQVYGSGFASLLTRLGESLLPNLYNCYVDVAVTPKELDQLLGLELTGISAKFMPDVLGIFALDAGKYTPTCQGEVPSRIEQYVISEGGLDGSSLLSHFGGPPFGYPADVVRACLAGLLRASKIRIRPEAGNDITSVRDPGAQDLFTKDRDLKRADVLPPSEEGVKARDRVAICKLFKDILGIDLDRDNDTLADAVFKYFPAQATKLRELEQRYNKLPHRPALPQDLSKLQTVLAKCMKSRQVEPTLQEVKRQLDALRDGLDALQRLHSEVTDKAVAAVAKAVDLQRVQVAQLQQISRLDKVADAVNELEAQLALERPWRDMASLEPQMKEIVDHYQCVRQELLEQQEQQFETVRRELQERQGYYSLAETKANQVIQPLRDAKSNTTADAIFPALVELKEPAQAKLFKAKEKAHQYLSEALAEITGEQVIEVDLKAMVSNQEISNPAEVEVLVNRIRQELLDKLEGSDDIRIRLI